MYKTKDFLCMIFKLLNITCFKIDGVGPVDNRRFTDKLHYFSTFEKN